MTIASEITRLQGAKASARTSIINKGVNVPDSVKVDDYHTYIDMINAGGGNYEGLTLTSWYFDNRDYSTIAGFYSWIDGNIQYGLVLASADSDSSDHTYTYGGTGIKHVKGNAISYLTRKSGNYSENYHTEATSGGYFIKNSTAGIVRGYLLDITSYSTNPVWTFEVVYDYINNTCSSSVYSQGTSTNFEDIVTVPAGYEVVSGNEWIGNITAERVDNTSRFYITLK